MPSYKNLMYTTILIIWSLNDSFSIVSFFNIIIFLGKGLIDKIEVLKDIGQVLLEFKSSPNVCLLCTFLDE